jgi:ubiquinone/menaquinone biosynthesis C-methylase UbiE
VAPETTLKGGARVQASDQTVIELLRQARRAAGVRYVAASAEDLPLRNGRFDLVLACGSMDWVDRPRFLPRAADLLVLGV